MNINEIAKLAGVSRATVSRYLNQGYVSAEKKEKIRKIIEETGYHPSNSAKTLRSRRTNFIGVIIPKINSDSIGRMVAGITQSISQGGYQCLLACTNNDIQEELRYLNTFNDQNVDGVILIGTIFTPEHKERLKHLSVPIVILSQQLDGYSCVYSDDYQASYELSHQLARTGQIFGYIGAEARDIAVGHQRKQGFLDAIRHSGHPESSCFFEEAAFSMESGYEKARELFLAHPDIDTLVCATDTIASGALRYLHEQNLSVPSQVQIAGFGDSSIARATTPTLSTAHFFYEEAGTETAKILLDMMQEKEHPLNRQLKLGFQIIRRNSTR